MKQERVTPQSLDAEQACLGAMLMERKAVSRAAMIVTSSDFYRPLHRKIVAVVMALYDANKPVDPITTVEELRRRGQLEEVGGAAYIFALVESCPSAENVESYANTVLEKSLLRQIIEASEKTIAEAYAEERPAAEILSAGERRYLDIGKGDTRESFVWISELVDEECRAIKKASEDPHNVTGIPTGFFDFDEFTGGVQRKELVVVGGRPSMGKTAWTLQAGEHIARTLNQPVAVVSLEMGGSQLVRRLLSSESEINGRVLRSGHLRDDQWLSLADASVRLKGVPLFIRDIPAATTFESKTHLRRLEAEHGQLGGIVVDHLGLTGYHGKNTNRYQVVGEMCHDYKAIAKEMNCPLFLLIQLGRKVEEREDKRPVLSDGRESGDIEQDADLAIFLYREMYYKKKEMGQQWGADEPDIAEILIEKNRDGMTGVIKQLWRPEITRFENLARGGY